MAYIFPSFLFFFFLLLLLLLLSPLMAASAPVQMSDAAALLRLKSSFGNATALSKWSSSSPSPPCDPNTPWPGLICFHGIVTGLRLQGLGLTGTIDAEALAHFPALRTASFAQNSLSGALPAALTGLNALKSLYLSNNAFSGRLPESFFSSMSHLKKLFLDNNSFSGLIPSSIINATRLLELRLDHNKFDGSLPPTLPPSIKVFNISYNNLTGPVPESLAALFNASSFLANPNLCGPPLDSACPSPLHPPDNISHIKRKDTMLILAFLVLIIIMLSAALIFICHRRSDPVFDTVGVGIAGETNEAATGAVFTEQKEPLPLHQPQEPGSTHKSSGSSRAGGSGSVSVGSVSSGAIAGVTELVMVNEDRGVFGLPDLMKASAEVLGNGGLGSAYKAVMATGLSVAVKRVRDMNRVGKEEFGTELQRHGRLRHPNVLTPLAYHYRKEEKLIVSEYVPKGSLLYVLHGDRGPNHMALTWPTRLKIARGIARGTSYLHAELRSLDCPHGNLKSGNVLLGADFEPLLVDYGFLGLINTSQAPHAMFAFKSPESLLHRHVSPKSDVYCLGVVLLELLTGKFPSQYLSNTKGGTDVVQWANSAIAERREGELLDPNITCTEHAPSGAEMVRLLRVGSACTDPNPEKRPEMREVAELVEEIAAAAISGESTNSGDGGGDSDGSAGDNPGVFDG
ncbi:pollen receptor-like kinase 3 [Typha latifolia]|uniref:pollen receptor-like kinase 3 n=1 Tax=Typha latifolia TaxID=4733 RepID=UPI003C2C45EA